MKKNTLSPLHVLLFSHILIFQFSCSKDSDLLADYVISDAQEAILIDDIFVVSLNGSTVLDVLSNDTFDSQEDITITETSTPTNGTVEINADNTLTYTPETTEETTDSFTYTTEVVNEDASISAETGNVTVTTENRAPITGDNVYYVTTTGKANNDGSSEATAWNIQHAFATAVAGDIVYVKAGNYGALQLSTSSAGTPTSPIQFIGYTTTPHDISASGGPSYSYANWLSNSSDLPDNVMPHLELNPSNNTPTTGQDAININHSYVEIHNFMVSEYWTGIQVNASNSTLNNVIGDQFGGWNPNETGWNASSDSFSYSTSFRSGYGIDVVGNSTTLTNCLIIDAGFVTYFVKSDNNTITNCWGVAERAGNGADYIWDFFGSSNNVINGCVGRRNYGGDDGHRSRALSFQEESDDNILNNFTSINARIQIEGSWGNEITGLDISVVNGGHGENDGSIQIYGQSNNNIFTNVSIKGAGGLSFLGDSAGSGGSGRSGVTHTSAGEDNYFSNVNISDLNNDGGNGVISFHRLGGNNGITGGANYINGLIADNFKWTINANRGGTIHIENANFSNGTGSTIDTFYSGWHDGTDEYTATFTNCTFSGINFSTPSGN